MRDVELPDEVAGKESERNEENAPNDRAVAEENQDEAEMIAEVEIGPPAMFDTHESAFDQHEGKPISDDADIKRGEHVEEALIPAAKSTGPNRKQSRSKAGHCARDQPTRLEPLTEIAAHHANGEEIPEQSDRN